MPSTKERVWLEEYFKCWNATEAARRADYKHPNVQGPQKKAKFAEEIKARLDEKAMSAEEVLAHLADQARGTADFYLDDYGHINLDKVREAGMMHLIKKYKYVTYETGSREEVELYDAQAALKLIGEHHGLFTKKLDITSDGEPISIYLPQNDRDGD